MDITQTDWLSLHATNGLISSQLVYFFMGYLLGELKKKSSER